MKRPRAMLLRAGGGLAVTAVLLAVGLPAAHGGFSAGDTNPAGSYASGATVLSATANAGTCRTSGTTISTNANGNCSGTLFPAALSGGSASASATVANAGNLSAGSVQLAAGPSCGVLDTPDDSTTGNNSATLIGGVQPTGNSPFPAGSALAFDGSTGALRTQDAYSNPQTYSLAAWFYAPSGPGDGGDIIGFTNLQSETGTNSADRMLWMNSAGNLLFGVKGPYTNVIGTGAKYNNSTWYFVVVEQSYGGATIYVNGAQVAGDSDYSSAANYDGFWHIGWAEAAYWPEEPSQQFFDGDLADVAVFPTALSPSAMSSLYNAGSQAAEQAAILADSPSAYWPLTSTGTATSGQIQTTGTNTTNVTYCDQVDATVEDDTVSGSPVCLLPAGSGSCPALSATTSLSSLAGSTLTLPTIAAGSSDTLKVALEDQSSAYEGMDFSLPLTLSAASGGFTASLSYPAGTSAQTFTG